MKLLILILALGFTFSAPELEAKEARSCPNATKNGLFKHTNPKGRISKAKPKAAKSAPTKRTARAQ